MSLEQIHKSSIWAALAVCSVSRGLDSVYVGHVVLFDFPRDPSEYVRRVGRTARGAAGTGVVSVLVLGRQVRVAQQIINRNQQGAPVHTVPGMSQRGIRDAAPLLRGAADERPSAPVMM